MSTRTFIFCDYCNHSGVRVIEGRRDSARSFENSGRRHSDGRAWFDGTREEARAHGWRIDAENLDVCPQCVARGLGVFEHARNLG
jgi:hypothetical protein